MRTKQEIEIQHTKAHIELTRIEKETNAGNRLWRIQKGYVNALEWVLELE